MRFTVFSQLSNDHRSSRPSKVNPQRESTPVLSVLRFCHVIGILGFHFVHAEKTSAFGSSGNDFFVFRFNLTISFSVHVNLWKNAFIPWVYLRVALSGQYRFFRRE